MDKKYYYDPNDGKRISKIIVLSYSELLNSKKQVGKRMKTPLQNKILESEYEKDPTLWSKEKIS